MASAGDNNDPITFVVLGQVQAEASPRSSAGLTDGSAGRSKVSIRMHAARTGGTEQQQLQAVPGKDVVALHIAGGPVLLLHPHTARDLMLAQRPAVSETSLTAPVHVPGELCWPGQEQTAASRGGSGWAGRVTLTAVEILAFDNDDVGAARHVVRLATEVDNQVEAGVYGLSSESLAPLKGSGRLLTSVPTSDEPILVLLHGTFLDTAKTFGKLWDLHPDRVRTLFSHYGERVYALDHPTLLSTPIDNALTLVRALPHGARLHLVTHSGGGLIAEVLARLAHRQGACVADLDAVAESDNALQRGELAALAREVQAKQIRIERVVRVACPARGTLMASKRLDAFVSVLKWSMERADLAVLPALTGLLIAAALRRAGPGELPGLAATISGSPLIDWLNASGETIAGELRVVAGDLQGDSITSWLKTLMADGYYWTDNDIFVQTRSMYGGAPREGGAQFLLDRGSKVTHFNYFANDRTVQAVLAGLMQTEPAGYGVIGPLTWGGVDASGTRWGTHPAIDVRPAAEKPAVFVLPGFLGSNLAADGHRIWLSRRMLVDFEKLAYGDVSDTVTPDGPIDPSYGSLVDHLAVSNEVIPFSYDWRCPIELEARRLASVVDAALDARSETGQPVRLVAHSTGGLLVRVMQLERPATFQRLMQHDGARLLMLGTPNDGSWVPMQVLSGDDTFGKALAAFRSPLASQRARQIMAEMPGFLQLQAGLLNPHLALDQTATWEQLAQADIAAIKQINCWHGYAGKAAEAGYQWGIPPQAVLDAARLLQQRLRTQCLQALPAFASKLCLVVGGSSYTPDGIEQDERGLNYLDAVEGGDGRVTLASALLPGVRTWILEAENGRLPIEDTAFAAFDELLEAGNTVRLARLESSASPSTRRLTHVRNRPSQTPQKAQPAGDEASVFASSSTLQDWDAAAATSADSARATALRVTVHNGNLCFIGQPLLVGHYQAAALSGSESAIDRLIGGSMSASLSVGLYPEALGTHQVFINGSHSPASPLRSHGPHSVIVVGLGQEGSVRQADIVKSVRQGVIAWAQRAAEDQQHGSAVFELAATLLGSGGIGITASSAAAAITRGVHEANDSLRPGGWPVVDRLVLVELYLDRANDAWQSLHLLAASNPQIVELKSTIETGIGPLRSQLEGGYRGCEYDLITATSGDTAGTLLYAVDTRRARSEMRVQVTHGALLPELINGAAYNRPSDPQIGRMLYGLLLPVEMDAYFGGTDRVMLELDAGTAAIPWELLDMGSNAGSGDRRPWAVRTWLLRRLRGSNLRDFVRKPSADDAVLVIGEPLCDAARYPPLPGARAEAEAVVAQLTGPDGLDGSRVKAVLGGEADALAVVSALLSRPYRIVHITGHGEPPGGVALSNGSSLGAREISSMRILPELVFVNYCHRPDFSNGQMLNSVAPSALAAEVAQQLISVGVSCVVAAGWTVDCAGAATFATTFYRELLAGQTFVTAVAAAREATWSINPSSNTWAAYQCYGDPDWTYRHPSIEAQTAKPRPSNVYDAIASPVTLALALEEMVTRSRYMGAQREPQFDRLRLLEARFGALWGEIGAVAEGFGLAWLEAGDLERAMAWYERALLANDGSATLKAHDQLLNLRLRVASRVASVDHDSDAVGRGRSTILGAIEELRSVLRRNATVERYCLLGSAYKQLALLERRNGGNETKELKRALEAFREAEVLATQTRQRNLYYPALNRMAIELVLQTQRRDRATWDRQAADAARASLQRMQQEEPDFWTSVALVELKLYEAATTGTLAANHQSIQAAYTDLFNRVSAPAMWEPVAAQAQFALVPYRAVSSSAEQRAAQAVLHQLGRFAHPVAADFARWSTAISIASAPVDPDFDAVVWHSGTREAIVEAVVATLTANGLRVWQRQQVRRGADRLAELQDALRHARMAVVVLDGSAIEHREQTLAEWTLLQEAAWRTSRPVLLATVVSPSASVPGFLQDALRIDASAVKNNPQALDNLLAAAGAASR